MSKKLINESGDFEELYRALGGRDQPLMLYTNEDVTCNREKQTIFCMYPSNVYAPNETLTSITIDVRGKKAQVVKTGAKRDTYRRERQNAIRVLRQRGFSIEKRVVSQNDMVNDVVIVT
ncbi:MAG: hypothetical protein KKE50_00260 [Nanoarchaeota archaeon]|nr:hypothetical protein [Nanoarchaeota archaeon]